MTAYGDRLLKSLSRVQSSNKVLDPFKSIEVKQMIRTIFMRLDTMDYSQIFRGQYHRSLTNKIDFTKTLAREIKEQLAALFRIELPAGGNFSSEISKVEERPVADPTSSPTAEGIFPKRRYISTGTGEPRGRNWDSPLERGESQMLFELFYYIAVLFEIYIWREKISYNRVKHRYESLGMSWLRVFASVRNLMVAVVGLIVLYWVIRTVMLHLIA